MPTSVIGAVSRSPPISMLPALAGSRPETSSMVVLLPQPEGPIRLTNSPGLTSTSIGPRA
jgi:hypothetical protein